MYRIGSEEYMDLIEDNIIYIGRKRMNPRYMNIQAVILDVDGKKQCSEILARIFNVYHNEYTYSLRFSIGGIDIEENNVSKVFICTKNDVDKSYIVYGGSEWVFEKKDLADYYLLFYKENSKGKETARHYDVVIYHNGIYLHTIKHCMDLLDPYYSLKVLSEDHPLDFKTLRFDRQVIYRKKVLNERFLLIDCAQEISVKDSSLSLYEWNKSVNNHCNSFCDIGRSYCNSNKIQLNDISWNSNEIVNWQCFFGHKWRKKVKYVTCNEDDYMICPYCREYYPGLRPDSRNHFSDIMIERLFFLKKQLNISDEASFKSVIENEYAYASQLVERVGGDAYLTWMHEPSSSEYIKTRFWYPDGKMGDIKLWLFNRIGSVNQIRPRLFEAVVPVDEKDAFVSTLYNSLFDFPTGKDDSELFLFNYNLLFRYVALKWAMSFFHSALATTDNAVEKMFSLPLKEAYERLYGECVYDGQSTYRWKNETRLYQFVKKRFDDAVFQYKPNWLKGLSLDIYVPSLRIGIEYQGVQHYEPIRFFGGEEGLKQRRERDKTKRKLCQKNDVMLIEWKHTIPITNESVREVLSNKINKSDDAKT